VLNDIVLECALLSTSSPKEDFLFAWTCIGSCEAARGFLSNSSSLQFPKLSLPSGQFVFVVEVTPRKRSSSSSTQVASSVVTIDVKGTQVPEVALDIDTSKTFVDTQIPGVFGQVNANDKIVIVGELTPPPPPLNPSLKILTLPPYYAQL
jgi:hypothetical protein